MKKIDCLPSFHYYLFEICFPKELFVVPKIKYCVSSADIGVPSILCPRSENPPKMLQLKWLEQLRAKLSRDGW